MKSVRKFLALLTCLTLCLSFVPGAWAKEENILTINESARYDSSNGGFVSFSVATPGEIQAKIAQIGNKINGKYWNGNKTEVDLKNHINVQDYLYGTTNSPCSGERTAHNTNGTGCTSNTFKGGKECNGFARYMAYAVFGVDFNLTNNTWTNYRYETARNLRLLPGDIIYFFNSSTASGGVHWAMVWYVDGDNLYIADANRGTNCKIFFGKHWSESVILNEAVAGTISISRPACNLNGVTDPVDPIASESISSNDGLHRYEIYDNVSYTWTEAEAFCESREGHLATILTSDEQQTLVGLASGGTKTYYWIGGTDAASKGTWKWVTGQTFWTGGTNGSAVSGYYANWDPDAPEPNCRDGENYAAIMGKNVGTRKQIGEWIDVYNGGDTSNADYALSKSGFICEYDYVLFDANGGTGAPQMQFKVLNNDLVISDTKPTRANASAGKYTVTLNANGGSVSPASLDAARTTSYTFKNWNTKSDGEGTSYNAGASYTANEAATLYAQWNSSTTTAAVTLPTPTRTGYTFKGWSTSSTATSGSTGKYTPNGNVTLYAVWAANKYTVSYNANGGTGAPANQTKTHGTNLTLSSTKPTRANSSAESYTVTLNTNGGSVSATSLDAARTTSYTFKNWNTKQDGSGTSYNAGASYTANEAATLYAQWNSSTSTATVTLPTPTRTGYTFKGWGTSSTASSGATGKYTPSGNVTLYAAWIPNTYTITYNPNGGTGAPEAQTKKYDETMKLSTLIPTHAGYTFLGWAESANATTATYLPGGEFVKNADTTLYAVWQKNAPDFILPAALKEIGEEAFTNCAFGYVHIPDGVTRIERRAFADCPNLHDVDIPESATSIDPTAFAGTNGLTIHSADGSYAEFYAGKYGFAFIPVA